MARRLRSFFFDNKKGKLFTGVNYTLKDIENEVEGTESIDGTKVSDFARSAIQTGAQPFLDNNTSILTAAATDNRINAVVNSVIDSAPGALDTLNELAAALGDDANFSTTVTNSIATKWTQDNTKISNWNTAYGWGNHASSGYLTGNQSITLSGDLTGSGTTTINAQIAANAIGITELNVTEGTNGQVLTTNGAGTLSFADAGNATTATTLQTSRTIALGGVLSGSASFDGSSNITITAAHTSDPVITLTGAVTGSGTMTNLGNVSIATTATADPTLTLAGDVTGSATFTNLGNATLTAVVADDSHNHIISNVDGLQTALDAKLASSSYTAADVLTKIKTVDGSNSGLDADLLDGQQGSYYTGYTDTAIANLVDSAPATLDTLNELAAALGDDPNFATTVTNSIATKLPSASYTAADVLTKIKTVDGTASGLDADLLDGQQGTYYYPASNPNGYTTNVGDITGVTAGSYITGGGTSGTVTVNVDATTTNTASKVVARDASGNFAAGTITAALSGNATTATTLQTARTINGVSFNGSANITVTANTPNTLTRGTYLTGSNFNGSAATTWAVDATSANTASKVVARDASGNFAAGTITAALSGNATTATTLQTARTINGVSFNGSANITVADATKLPLTGGALSGNLDVNADINGVNNIYLADNLYHEGDTDTALTFADNTITLSTGGSSEITVNTTGVRLGDTGNGYFQPVTGNYGSVQIDGGDHGGWEGYNIGSRAAFIHDNSSTMGLIDDVNNEWGFRYTFNGAAELYYNATSRLQTTNTGANVTGTLTVTNVDEGVYSNTGTTLNPALGAIQYKTLAANTTFTDSVDDGESMTLRLDGGATYTVTWPTMTWITSGGNVAPTLNGTKDTLVFWKEGTTLYGAYVGYGA